MYLVCKLLRYSAAVRGCQALISEKAFSTSFLNHGTSKYHASKLSVKMTKVVQSMNAKGDAGVPVSGGSRSKRRKFHHANLAGSAAPDVLRSSCGPSAGSQRRARQLSVVLSEYISSLMSSGEVCPQAVDRGFEISKVKIPADFGSIAVHWIACGVASKDQQMQELLDSHSAALRSALIRLGIMGKLPPIQFVKDRSFCKAEEVQELLKLADMGPDHEPTELGHNMKSEVFLQPPPPPSKKTLQQQMSAVSDHFRQDTILSQYGSTRHSDPQTNCTEQSKAQLGALRDDFQGSSNAYHSSSQVRFAGNDKQEAGPHSDDPGTSGARGDIGKNAPEVIRLFSDIDLSSDIYELDHKSMVQQVLHARQKARDRNYKMPSQDSVGYNIKSVASVDFSRGTTSPAKVKKILAGYQRAKESAKQSRYKQGDTLSSRYWVDVDADQSEEHDGATDFDDQEEWNECDDFEDTKH